MLPACLLPCPSNNGFPGNIYKGLFYSTGFKSHHFRITSIETKGYPTERYSTCFSLVSLAILFKSSTPPSGELKQLRQINLQSLSFCGTCFQKASFRVKYYFHICCQIQRSFLQASDTNNFALVLLSPYKSLFKKTK